MTDCHACPRRPEYTRDRARSVSYHLYKEAIDKTKELNKTKGYRLSKRMRKQIEELFGEAKELMGLRRAKFRGLRFVREQVLMTATAQNIKRMVKLLSRSGPQTGAMAVGPLRMGQEERASAVSISLMKEILSAYEWYFART